MNTPTAKVENFTRAVARHQATCDGELTIVERRIRPMIDATIGLACATCGRTYRECFTPIDATSVAADFERLFQALVGRAIN